MSRPFPVAKRGVRFFIDADAKCVAQSRQIDWYLQWWIKRYKGWEDRTFIILDTFLDARRSFIDVGAWIGPTVLYGAAKAQHIYCFEPDPEAYRVLMLNVSVNPQYRNITVLNAALADSDGGALLRSSGHLGDSASTILVQPVRTAPDGGLAPVRDRTEAAAKVESTVEVPTITMDTFQRRHPIDGCSLMKIDIEGGERIVLPVLEPFLRRYRPTLYLSLHWTRLSETEIESLFDLVSSIYDCIYDDSLLRTLDRQRLVSEKMSSIVCTSTPLSALQRLRIRRMILTRWFRHALESVTASLSATRDSEPAREIENV